MLAAWSAIRPRHFATLMLRIAGFGQTGADFGLAPHHDGDDAVGRTQVDSDDLAHGLFLLAERATAVVF